MDRWENFSIRPEYQNCVQSFATRSIFTASLSMFLLLLPVFLFVLYIGFNKWKKPQSSASGGLSHSDVFTLNMVSMEMINIFGTCIILYGSYRLSDLSLKVGVHLVLITLTGQSLFHSLTCVERYLAVVHPVTYLRLRGEGGVTVRNISIASVWIFSVLYTVPIGIVNKPGTFGLSGFALSIAELPVVAYCSVCVLCVLIRPKPGEGGGHGKQIDQSKRTIVYTMVAILGALLLRLTTFAVNGCLHFWLSKEIDGCALLTATFCTALPSSMVLPVLFLHRNRNK